MTTVTILPKTSRLSTYTLKKLASTTALTAVFVTMSTAAFAVDDFQTPTGANVVGGVANIHQPSTGVLNVNQQTNRVVIDWDQFNIGAKAKTEFFQPNANALAVNRVTGGSDPTKIMGTLKANGRVMILDQNGVIFGRNSVVDVGGIVASTGQLSTSDVMDGDNKFLFSGFGDGAIEMYGTMNVKNSGLAAFVSPFVSNHGTINAKLGSVAFAAGENVTLDLYGDELMSIAVSGELKDALLKNSGTINAEGGVVEMTASAAKTAVDNIINMDGIVNVSSFENKGGKIILKGGAKGTVSIAGKVDASGTDGGNINVTGERIDITETAELTANGDNIGGNIDVIARNRLRLAGYISAAGQNKTGFVETSAPYIDFMSTARVQAGHWLIDPVDLVIDAVLEGILESGLAGGSDVTLTAADPAGSNISFETIIDWATGNSFTVNSNDRITFTATGGINSTGGGNTTLTAANLIAVNSSSTMLSNGGDIAFISDEFNINAAVNVGTGRVIFDRYTAGLLSVGLAAGTSTGGADLDDDEIGRIAAKDLILGRSNASDNNITLLNSIGFSFAGAVQMNALANSSSYIGMSNGLHSFDSVQMNANDGVTFISDTTITTTVGDVKLDVDADDTGVVGGFDDLRAQTGVTTVINSAADIEVTAPQYVEAGTGTISLNAANEIRLLRSTVGRISLGDQTAGLSFNQAQLSRMTAAKIVIGDANTSAVNVGITDMSHIADVDINAKANEKTVHFKATSSFANLDVDAPTVNINADITATTMTGNANTVNIQGSAGGAEIQDGIDIAASGATVNVAAGSYAGFTTDFANITVSGAGTTTVVNAASPAVTVAANNVTIQNMLLQGTGTAGEIGVLLDGTASPHLTGVQINNVNFSNLDDGVRSQGNIGDGVAANVDVTISNGVFEDFLDSAIDVGDWDAVYNFSNLTVRDGADADAFSTGGNGFKFDNAMGVTISNVNIADTKDNGIKFGEISSLSDTSISGSSISGGLHGILFDGEIGSANVDIANNSLIKGANQGVVFTRDISHSSITLRGNDIQGAFDAIAINGGNLRNVDFTIGGASAASGNKLSSTNGQAIDVESIEGGKFIVANNSQIHGGSSVAIEFESTIFNDAEVLIVNNADISGTTRGIGFFDSITDNSEIVIAGNTISSTNNDAIFFETGKFITDSDITIGRASNVRVGRTFLNPGGNTLSTGGNGINVKSTVDGDSEFSIEGNTIGTAATRIGGDGIRFGGGILDTATVSIGGTNSVFATGQAIDINDLQSPSTLAITGGIYNGTGGALFVDNTGVAGTDGRLNIGAANFAGGAGSTVLNVLTDTGNAGVDINFGGAATFDGGATGIKLSGTGIDILNDTLGTIAFTNQTGHYITLANGAEFLPGSPTILNATGVSFEGTLASAMSVAQLQALETRLTHYPDNNTLGLLNTNDLFVVTGESIQTAVNAAGLLAGPQTVSVQSGTFGGSIEAWVDNLTLTGQGATTIIDTDAVDAFANNGDTNNGFQVAAISATSGGGDVSGVTIGGFNFDTLTSSDLNIGVELGEAGSSTAFGTTVQNSRFNDLKYGIFGNAVRGTTTFSSLTMTDIATDGIRLPNLDNASVILKDSSIISGNYGVYIDGSITNGSNLDIFNNDVIEGGNRAIQILGAVNNSDIGIAGNGRIQSNSFTIVLDSSVTNSDIRIAGNNDVISDTSDAIIIDGTATNSNIIIGATTVNIAGVDTAFGGNGNIQGGDDGIDIDALSGGSFTVINNTLIQGQSSDGIEFDDNISNGASISIVGNAISGRAYGIDIDGMITGATTSVTIGGATPADGNTIIGLDKGIDFDNVTDSTITVSNNAHIKGTTGDGVSFDAINGAQISISDNTLIESVTDDGIEFDSTINGGATITVAGNTVNAGDDGIEFDAAITGATTSATIGGATPADGNTIVALEDGIDLDAIDASTVTVSNNSEITGTTGDGIELARILTNGATLNIASNQNVTGGEHGAFLSNILNDATVNITESALGGVLGGLTILNSGTGRTAGNLNLTDTTLTATTGPALGVVVNGKIPTGLNIDLNGGGSILTGTTGMTLSGYGLALVGDTLADTTLNTVGGGDFITLADNALFDPGAPTVIDALDVSFDGFVPSKSPFGPGILSQAQYNALENTIFHFVDDNTLGLFNFGEIPAINQEDTLNGFNDIISPNSRMFVTILGLPSVSVDPSALNSITPFAGGDDLTAEELNNISTAAGSLEVTACWGNALSAAGAGQAITLGYQDNAKTLFDVATNCDANL